MNITAEQLSRLPNLFQVEVIQNNLFSIVENRSDFLNSDDSGILANKYFWQILRERPDAPINFGKKQYETDVDWLEEIQKNMLSLGCCHPEKFLASCQDFMFYDPSTWYKYCKNQEIDPCLLINKQAESQKIDIVKSIVTSENIYELEKTFGVSFLFVSAYENWLNCKSATNWLKTNGFVFERYVLNENQDLENAIESGNYLCLWRSKRFPILEALLKIEEAKRIYFNKVSDTIKNIEAQRNELVGEKLSNASKFRLKDFSFQDDKVKIVVITSNHFSDFDSPENVEIKSKSTGKGILSKWSNGAISFEIEYPVLESYFVEKDVKSRLLTLLNGYYQEQKN